MRAFALLFIAFAAAVFVAYGVHPALAQYPHGMAIILAARRLQLPLVALVVVACVTLLALIIAGKQRAWWLIGLGPIAALLAHRFVLDPNSMFLVNGQPAFVSADQAEQRRIIADDDWVIGINLSGQATAYPYSALYSAPLVVQQDQISPTMLMWSPFANRALAVHIDRTIKPEELQVVSMPANTLLIYNERIGQFINGITGLTPKGEKPEGLSDEIPTVKTTWHEWLAMHPDTRVLLPTVMDGIAPTRPVLPCFPMPKSGDDSGTVAFIGGEHPCAIMDSDITATPLNISTGSQSLLLMRDPSTGVFHAWDRNVDADLTPSFRVHPFAKFPDGFMIDSDSASPWTRDGRALDGPLKGERLKAAVVDDQVYLSVLKFSYPNLKIIQTGK